MAHRYWYIYNRFISMQLILCLNYDTNKCSHQSNSTHAENTVKHFLHTCSIYPVT